MTLTSMPWARAVLFLDNDDQASIPVQDSQNAGHPKQCLEQVARNWPKAEVGKPITGVLIRQRDNLVLATWSASQDAADN